MLKVGITGGIGSGKSTVAKVFEVLGIPVYYADEAAKYLMQEDETLKAALREAFGEETYLDGRLNRPYLSSIVFKDKEKLALLNSLVHPATIRYGQEWLNRQTTPYALKEAALIFESGTHAELDVVIGVYAPVPLRIKRVMERDKVSPEEVQKRMNNQIQEEIKMRLCNFVITNDDQQMVIPQVLALHQQLLQQAQ